MASEPLRPRATRAVVRGRHGMVAAAQPLAVEAGVRILRAGGSAVDAAIATNAVLAVTEPNACGLGGDLFVLLNDPKTNELVGLDASGRAGTRATIDAITPTDDGLIDLRSAQSWTVPGAVDGWFVMHERFGRLPMKDLLADAIAVATEGFPVSEVVAAGWKHGQRYRDIAGFADVYLPDGRAPKEGELFANPAMGRAFELLVAEGRNGFYEGAIAESLVRFSTEQGGFLELEDLAATRSTWIAPMSTSYRGRVVHQLPPAGQGLAVLQMLNIIEGDDLAALGFDSPDRWHLLIEAKKLAYADRARFYADPEVNDLPLDELVSKAHGRNLRDRIDPARAALAIEPGDPRLATGDTTYLATADADGMMVSWIQSNYTGFGSGHVLAEWGFGLQNRGGLFALDPEHPNALAPSKRPFHTIIPGFVTENDAPLMAFGLMGGDMQPQGHAQVLVNLWEHGMNLQEAGDVARFHHGGLDEPTGPGPRDGGELSLEAAVPAAVVDELKRRGHRIADEPGYFGGYQAVGRDPETGCYLGATESRKDGCALGW
ncbi:MAG: gamma-glutamyltransferase family protein [Acidobacteriota bacterium]